MKLVGDSRSSRFSLFTFPLCRASDIFRTVFLLVFLKVAQFCYVFDGLLSIESKLTSDRLAEIGQEDDAPLESKVTKEELWEAMYVQACYWSFGASVVDTARSKFDEYMKKTYGLLPAQDTPTKPAATSEYIKNAVNLFSRVTSFPRLLLLEKLSRR